jgi:hypothetical protein
MTTNSNVHPVTEFKRTHRSKEQVHALAESGISRRTETVMQGNSRAPCFGADRAGDARSEVVQKSEWGRQVFMWGWGKGEVMSSGEYQMLPLMTRSRVTRPTARLPNNAAPTPAVELVFGRIQPLSGY